MSRNGQYLLSDGLKARTAHGGDLTKGHRKFARPIAVRRPMHLVLRAVAARGKLSLLRPENARAVERLLKETSKKFHVQVYEFANVGNHLHLLVRAHCREGFRNFLRVLAGGIAQKVTGARKGKPGTRRFWDLLAFSRIVEWGRAFAIARRYVVKNQIEALGLMSPKLTGFVPGG